MRKLIAMLRRIWCAVWGHRPGPHGDFMSHAIDPRTVTRHGLPVTASRMRFWHCPRCKRAVAEYETHAGGES